AGTAMSQIFGPDKGTGFEYMVRGNLRLVFAAIHQNCCWTRMPDAFKGRCIGTRLCSPIISSVRKIPVTTWIPPHTSHDLSSLIRVLIGTMNNGCRRLGI